MNGTEPRIEIFKPFGEAWDLMKKILFQPFDLRKWLVIGFAAFLARFSAGLSGGFHFNPSGFYSRSDRRALARAFSRDFPQFDQMEWWVIGLIAVAVITFVALVVFLLWIGARGRFIFTDCIVRNRAAIVAPWKEYRIEGNSFFLFSLLAAFIIMLLVLLAAVPLVLPFILRDHHGTPPIWFWVGLALFLFFAMAISIGWAVIAHLMAPIMYRQRCRAREAFTKSIALIMSDPGPILLYFLFLIVIAIAAGVIACAVACLTCCIAAIPYVGTVILLPIPVTLYGFALLFLRQFGPDYDVWQAVAQPEPLTISAPPEPMPPPVQS